MTPSEYPRSRCEDYIFEAPGVYQLEALGELQLEAPCLLEFEAPS